ncbi:hypothetical protein B0H19DRAFT_1202670 [Mycena capillaripes]|nr:hypothetical protein B0H19DRAFT_1202670 [Mycena capillaripes]
MAPGPPYYTGVLLCVPTYAPDPGHEDRWSHPGPFYAVVCKEWKGAVTSLGSLDRMKLCYPNARMWEAAPWSTLYRMWNLDCTEYHYHDDDPPTMPESSMTPDSSVPSSPSSLTDSTILHHPSPSPSQLPNSVTSPSRSSAPHATAPFPPESPTKSKITKEELAFLASFRPGPGPISPQRLNQQFARVLGPQTVVPSLTQLAHEDSPATSLETQGSSLHIAAQTVEATLRAGCVRVKTKAPVPLEQRVRVDHKESKKTRCLRRPRVVAALARAGQPRSYALRGERA